MKAPFQTKYIRQKNSPVTSQLQSKQICSVQALWLGRLCYKFDRAMNLTPLCVEWDFQIDPDEDPRVSPRKWLFLWVIFALTGGIPRRRFILIKTLLPYRQLKCTGHLFHEKNSMPFFQIPKKGTNCLCLESISDWEQKGTGSFLQLAPVSVLNHAVSEESEPSGLLALVDGHQSLNQPIKQLGWVLPSVCIGRWTFNCIRPHSHRTRDTTRTQIWMQILWCCLHALWTLPLTTTGSICLRVLCEWGLSCPMPKFVHQNAGSAQACVPLVC